MSTKKIIVFLVIVLVVVAGFYAWNEYTRTAKDLKQVEASVTTGAIELVNEFMTDETAANTKYLEKIVMVKGMVKKIVPVDNTYTIVLGDSTDMSSVRCLVDSTHTAPVAGLQPGIMINIKGYLTGFKKDETGLLGSDVELNRCVIQQ